MSSKYWDPAWEQETVVLNLPWNETFQEAAGEMVAAQAADWPDHETKLCSNEDGVSRMAVFGPDYTVLVPAANRVSAAELQREIGSFNIYFICTRPRILASGERSTLTHDTVRVGFDAYLDDGSVDRLDIELPRPPNVESLTVDARGSEVYLELTDGGTAQYQAALLAQSLIRPEPWRPSFVDLDIRYIGRARGRMAETCALDRLESHKAYQLVLEEVINSAHRNREIWMILGSGTTLDISSFGPSDLDDADEEAYREAEPGMIARARSLLSKARRIDVAEALLINYFKPPYNDQHTGDLDLRSAVFKPCYDAEFSGISVVASGSDWRIGLYTEQVESKLNHSMTVCL